MENTVLWFSKKVKRIADTTYLSYRVEGGVHELLVHTETKKYSEVQKKWLRHHSAVLRIRKDREHPNNVLLRTTLYLKPGSNNPDRHLSRAEAGSMFAVTGYDLGRNSPLAQSKPGATHAMNRIFIRNAEYVEDNSGMVFRLIPELTAAMDLFLLTWTFPPPQVRKK